MTHGDGVQILRSSVLPAAFAHAFSTRIGGVSTGRYASLNLSTGWGDDPARVAENRRRFLAAAGLAGAAVATVRQVHGAAVVDAADAMDRSARGEPAIEADALVARSDAGRTALGILTADCVPLLLADRATGNVAAAHAGWRGTVADVAGAAVRALVALGGAASAIAAALGPSICAGCFEVGEEVAAAFASADLAAAVVRRPGWARPHVDLRVANALALRRAGVTAGAVDDAPPCTRCDTARFFSYRRDGGGIGQQLSVIAPPELS